MAEKTLEQAEVEIKSFQHDLLEGDDSYFLVFTLSGTIEGVDFVLMQTKKDTIKMAGGQAQAILAHDEIEDVKELLEHMFAAPTFTVGDEIVNKIQGLPKDRAQMIQAVKTAVFQKILQKGLYLKQLEAYMKECNEFAAELAE